MTSSLLLAAALAAGGPVAPPCPDLPFIEAEGSHCAVTADATLSATLVLRAFTILDCHGRRLSPAAAASIDGAGAVKASDPAIAIASTQASGIEVRNCDIAGFSHAIALLDSPHPQGPGDSGHLRNFIHHDAISAAAIGVTILRTDDTVVSDSHIVAGVAGVAIALGSGRSVVRGNVLEGTPTRGVSGVAFPGDPPGNLRFHQGVLVAQFRDHTLFRIPINGEPVLLPIDYELGPDGWPVEDVHDTLVEDNLFDLPSAPLGGVFAAAIDVHESNRTTIRGNTVTRSDTGALIAGLNPNTAIVVAGSCSEAGPLCRDDGDCPAGLRCDSPAPQASTWTGPSRGVVFEDNALIGPFNYSAMRLAFSEAPRVRRNLASGATRPLTGNARQSGGGIHILLRALETAVVTENVVTGNAYGLFLDPMQAAGFGAAISLNDFSGNLRTPVATRGSYHFASELDADGLGNFYGRSCAEGGFLPGDAVFEGTTTANTAVIDLHPLGAPPGDDPAACY